MSWSYNPAFAETKTVWAVPISFATTLGITNCFLFLQVLRCFSSLGLLQTKSDDRSSTCRVAPFGYLRINSYVPIPAAFRSLSRPSSPLEAKASAVCP